METPKKLQIIQQISGLTQTELAAKIGISFVAFNSLYNGKSRPRQKTLLAINELYLVVTGTNKIADGELNTKKQILKAKAKKYKSIIEAIISNQSVFDQLVLELTYHTNGIEGSTLSEGETAAILFENASIKGKTLSEQLEAKNHQTALLYLFDYLRNSSEITEALILKLHAILLNSIHSDAGYYRQHGVRIVGANIPTANFLKIPTLMADLVFDINHKDLDQILHVTNIHARFEQIHPFSDGNGRIGRLIMQAMLLINNLPPAVIKKQVKTSYLQYLNKAQTEEIYAHLEDFMCTAVEEGFKILVDI